MTHSHDTSTPAMSAETVPSEEFVLVPREPTKAMIAGGLNVDLSNEDEIASIYNVYHAMIAAAPAPIPSPAARGGEAVREALEREGRESYEIGKRDGYEEAVQHIDQRTGGDGEYCCVVGYDADDRHCPDPQSMIARIVERFEALSTPTEGPASQTEGMGGDAGAIRSAAFRLTPDEQHGLATALAANLGYDLTPEPPHPDAPGPGRFEAAAEKAFAASGEDTAVVVPEALAALTPPETAEAVPVGASARCSYCDGTGDVHRADGEWMGECDCSEGRFARLREDLERANAKADRVTKAYNMRLDEFVSQAEELAATKRERDDAVKALESVTEELGLFRDFVINNATVWTPGSNHHHPIWARVADRLGGYTSPRDGEKWHLVRAALATEAGHG